MASSLNLYLLVSFIFALTIAVILRYRDDGTKLKGPRGVLTALDLGGEHKDAQTKGLDTHNSRWKGQDVSGLGYKSCTIMDGGHPGGHRQDEGEDDLGRPEGRVAVIGLGMSGLTALKNLLEQGFDATGIEKNSYVGGLWQFTEDKTQISVLRTTVANASKQFGCFTDFPYPDDMPNYPSAAQTASYLRSYAEHFDLLPHCRLNTTIHHIKRSADGQAWDVHLSRPESASEPRSNALLATDAALDQERGQEDEQVKEIVVERYDKVLMCTGPWGEDFRPKYMGEELYQGKTIFTREYKGPEEFQGAKVVLVGMANSACDIACDLVGKAEKVYISHRSGVRIVPRMIDGKPADHGASRLLLGQMTFFERYIPLFADYIGSQFMESRMRRLYPQWRLLPAPPFMNTTGVISDKIIDRLADGSVISLGSIRSFYKDGIEVVDDDGDVASNEHLNETRSLDTNTKRLVVDTVIFCTGSQFDYSILSGDANPTISQSTAGWDRHIHSNGLKFPRLYQTLFHPDFADSLAFIGPCRGHSFSAHCSSDLSAQTIAQVWKRCSRGRSRGSESLSPSNTNNTSSSISPWLPSKEKMNGWCDENYAKSLSVISKWRTTKIGHTVPGGLERWENEVTGNGLNEYLGWGWTGWKFWWEERELYNLIQSGVVSPAVYRLFDSREGSRKKWDGARDEIYRVNGRVRSQNGKKKLEGR